MQSFQLINNYQQRLLKLFINFALLKIYFTSFEIIPDGDEIELLFGIVGIFLSVKSSD